MKCRGHAGLQELYTLANSVKSFLGPLKSYKFIFDQDTNDSNLTCSSFRLLESLDLSSAVGQSLNETIQAHQKMYKTGTTTLCFLVGAWSRAVLECLGQGVPIPLIISVMLDGLDYCIEQVQSLQIPINNVLVAEDSTNKRTISMDKNHCMSHASDSRTDCAQPFPKYTKQITHQIIRDQSIIQPYKRNKLSYSRYFSDAEESCLHDHTLENLTKSLSHGKPEVMNLVESAYHYLCKNTEEKNICKNQFHASQLHVCCLPGLSEVYSKASSGYTTLVSPENAAITKDLEGKSLQILLLDGDLTESYRHLGFNHPTNIKKISGIASLTETASNESWTNLAFRYLRQAKIDLILVRGDVCPSLLTCCFHRNILIVTKVKQNVLQAFSKATGAEPVAYLTQINPSFIGNGVFVSVCTNGNSVVEAGQRIAINITTNRLNLITVVLSNRLVSKLQVMEDQFWTCTYRLHNALHDQKVFYGGGAVELLCISHLRKLEEAAAQESTSDGGPFLSNASWMASRTRYYKPFIFRCLASGWYKYISALLSNTCEYSSELEALTFIQNELQNISSCQSAMAYMTNVYNAKVLFVDSLGLPSAYGSTPVYDNVISKLEAWRSALHLVLLVLQTDAEIITGSAAQEKILKADGLKDEYFFL
ncbi:chaperonin-containing T-complex member BBS12 [Pelodytes ibericus]